MPDIAVLELKVDDSEAAKASATLDNLTKTGGRTETMIGQLGKTMTSVGRGMSTYVTGPIVAGLTASFLAAEEAAQGMAKLDAVITATGGAAGVTAGHVVELAAQMQRTTTFEDDLVVASSAVLLTFKSIRNELGAGNDVFDRTVRSAADMATIFGGDLQSATVQLGKAIEDPIRGMAALTRVGVTFSDEQRNVIETLQKSGNLLGAQKVVLKALEGQFGGTAAAMAKTAGGQMKQAFNDLGDAAESVGAIVAPLVVKVAAGVKKLAATFAGLSPETKKTVVVMASLVAGVGPLLLVFGKVLTLLPQIKIALALLGGATGIGLVVLAVGVLVKVWTEWGYGITKIVSAFSDLVKTHLVDRFRAVVGWVIELIEPLIGAFRWLYEKVGGGHIPDLIGSIKSGFDKLDAYMSWPAQEATALVAANFVVMADTSVAAVVEMTEETRQKIGEMSEAVLRIVPAATAAGGAMRDYLTPEAKEAFLAAQKMKDDFEALGGTLEKVDVPAKKAGAALGGSEGLWGSIDKLVTKVTGAGDDGLFGAIGTLANKLGVGDSLMKALDSVKDKLDGPLSIVSAVGTVIDAFKGTGFAGAVKDFIGEVGLGKVLAMAGEVYTAIMRIINAVKQMTAGFGGGIGGGGLLGGGGGPTFPGMVSPPAGFPRPAGLSAGSSSGASFSVASSGGGGGSDAEVRVLQAGFSTLSQQLAQVTAALDDNRRELRRLQGAFA